VLAQTGETVLVRAVAGCWQSEMGEFSPALTTDTHTWAGIPAVMQIDTVPGRGRSDDPLGWAVRTITMGARQRFTDGYLVPRGSDSLELRWTNFGTVGVTVALTLIDDRLVGVADAWTDAVTSNKAQVVLVRVACPQEARHDRRLLRAGLTTEAFGP